MYARQLNYDMAEPENHDDEDQSYIDQAAILLSRENAIGISWGEFAQVATENIVGEDDKDFPLLQILLALRDGNHQLAQQIYLRRFDQIICECAEGMVTHAHSRKAA